MQLLTKAITKKAMNQYLMAKDMKQTVVAKYFDPTGSWSWYLMNMEDESGDYAWGIVKGYELEIGSFSIAEMMEIQLPFGLGIERDINWVPKPAHEVFESLKKGDYI
jgi:hypothetical protein